ncbi:hypothetical protein GW891_03440 [bacterium]|nr:hypothetical protein [bacterium]
MKFSIELFSINFFQIFIVIDKIGFSFISTGLYQSMSLIFSNIYLDNIIVSEFNILSLLIHSNSSNFAIFNNCHIVFMRANHSTL